MTQYANSGLETLAVNPVAPVGLAPGDEVYVFGTKVYVPGEVAKPNDTNVQFETVVVDERSIAVTLMPRPGGGSPPAIIVQVSTNANPGAAEIDIQDAAVDADGAYETPTGSTAYKITTFTQENAIWTAFAEISPAIGRFITLLIVANPNAVAWTAKICYV
jgi:hypothetical protein